MGIIGHINRLLSIIVSSINNMFVGRLWLVLGGYFALNLLLLYSQYDFQLPMFNWIFQGMSVFFDKNLVESFTHYPDHLVLLPFFVGRLKFLFGILLEGLVLGYVARVIYNKFRRISSSSSQWNKSTKSLWVHLAIAWAITNTLILLAGIYLPELTEGLIVGHSRREMLFDYMIMPTIYTLIFSVFYYVIPIISLSQSGIFYGIKQSFKLFMKRPIYTFTLSFLVLSGPIMISFITNNSASLVSKFRDDLILWVLVVSLVIETFANYIWISTSVKTLIEED